LSGVHVQIKKYAEGLPDTLTPPIRPLPFLYVSTGTETQFTNLLDPEPRSRRVFEVHRPETLAEWLSAPPLAEWTRGWTPVEQVGDTATEVYQGRPSSLRSRLRVMPPVEIRNLWPNKKRAIENLEKSLRDDRPRALIQMATGSGKTLLAVTAISGKRPHP
jgi:type I restriction enzyme, R subunit